MKKRTVWMCATGRLLNVYINNVLTIIDRPHSEDVRLSTPKWKMVWSHAACFTQKETNIFEQTPFKRFFSVHSHIFE